MILSETTTVPKDPQVRTDLVVAEVPVRRWYSESLLVRASKDLVLGLKRAVMKPFFDSGLLHRRRTLLPTGGLTLSEALETVHLLSCRDDLDHVLYVLS